MRRELIEQLLPGVFQRGARPGSPLDALLCAVEALHAPVEASLAEIDSVFDPRRTREDFVPLLGAWVDLRRIFENPAPYRLADARPPEADAITAGSLRELVAAAADLSRRRGTAAGLVDFLQLATGMRPFAVEEEVRDELGAVVPYHVRVRAPESARPQERLVRRIIEMEKPAHVTYALVYGAGDTEES